MVNVQGSKMPQSSSVDPIQLKEAGNSSFKEGDYPEALDYYTKAIKCEDITKQDLAVVYKNRAMVHLKTEEYIKR